MKLHTLRYSNPLSAILEDFLSIRFKPHQVVSAEQKMHNRQESTFSILDFLQYQISLKGTLGNKPKTVTIVLKHKHLVDRLYKAWNT